MTTIGDHDAVNSQADNEKTKDLSTDQTCASNTSMTVSSNCLDSTATGGTTSAAALVAGKVAAAATLVGSDVTVKNSNSSTKAEVRNDDTSIKSDAATPTTNSVAERGTTEAKVDKNISPATSKAIAASTLATGRSVSAKAATAVKPTTNTKTTESEAASPKSTSVEKTTPATKNNRSETASGKPATATNSAAATATKSSASKPVDTTDSGSTASGSGRSSFFSFWNFHPLRALRNIFFGYKQKEDPAAMENSPRAPERRKRALSTDELDKKSRESRVSAMFSKLSAKRSKPYNKDRSRSADNLVEQDDWIPAQHDIGGANGSRTSSSGEQSADNSRHEERQRSKSSVSSDLVFAAPVIIEDDWASGFFTEGWSADKQVRQADTYEAGIDEMDSIGASCARLDSKAVKDRLAVKQKGKRMSSALLLKTGGRLNSEPRSPLSSVAEASEVDEIKTPRKTAKLPPGYQSPAISCQTDEGFVSPSPLTQTSSLSATYVSTAASFDKSTNGAKETNINLTTVSKTNADTIKPLETAGLAAEALTTRSSAGKQDADSARRSMFMDDLKASVQRSSSRRGQGPPKVLPKKAKLGDNPASAADTTNDANDPGNGATEEKSIIAIKLESTDAMPPTSPPSAISEKVENIIVPNAGHSVTEIKDKSSDNVDSITTSKTDPNISNKSETFDSVSNATEIKTSVAHVSLRTIRTGNLEVPVGAAGSRLTAPMGLDKVFRAPSPARVKSIAEPTTVHPHLVSKEGHAAAGSGDDGSGEENEDDQAVGEHNEEEENPRIYARLKNQEFSPVVRQKKTKKANDDKEHCVTKL